MSKNETGSAQPTELIQSLIDSNLPLDWVTLEQFGTLIGYPSNRLYIAKNKWPEFEVWRKVGGKLYFSITGWNKWLSKERIQKALEYEATASRLTSLSKGDDVTLQFPNLRRPSASHKRDNYDLT